MVNQNFGCENKLRKIITYQLNYLISKDGVPKAALALPASDNKSSIKIIVREDTGAWVDHKERYWTVG